MTYLPIYPSLLRENPTFFHINMVKYGYNFTHNRGYLMITSANVSGKESPVMATLFFNTEQTREILAISDFALPLMQYYVAIGKQPNPVMEDAHLAELLGKSEKTIERTRLALTKAGWFRRIKTTSKGETCLTYLVGKTAVASNTQVHIKP